MTPATPPSSPICPSPRPPSCSPGSSADLGRDDATLGGQSEEHLVVEAPGAEALTPGTPLLAIPTHICPTCALHSWAYVIEGGEVVDRWNVEARGRVLGI